MKEGNIFRIGFLVLGLVLGEGQEGRKNMRKMDGHVFNVFFRKGKE